MPLPVPWHGVLSGFQNNHVPRIPLGFISSLVSRSLTLGSDQSQPDGGLLHCFAHVAWPHALLSMSMEAVHEQTHVQEGESTLLSLPPDMLNARI